MNKKLKKNLIEFGIIGAVFIGLFATGLHTEVFGFLQRGILKTGFLDPDLEKTTSEEITSAPVTKADLNFQLINAQGERVSLEDFKGKAIFLNVWATWCPPCIAEMPGINKLYNKVKDENVEFVMLSIDQSFEKAKDFKAKKNFDFEIYAPGGPLPQMYSSRSIPTTYVIDAKGNLVLTHMGMGDFDTKEFRNFLKKIQ